MLGLCAAESDPVAPFRLSRYGGPTCRRRRKRNTANAQRYEVRLLDNIMETTTALQQQTYVPSVLLPLSPGTQR